MALTVALARSWYSEGIRAQQLRWKPAWKAQGLPLEIPVGDEPQSTVLQVPPLSRKAGQLLCLRFAVRLHTKRPAGWHNYLALTINGATVTPMTKAGLPRLLNHSAFFRSTHPRMRRWPFFSSQFGVPALIVFHMPDFTSASIDGMVQTERDEGGWYLLDIDDLISADAPNTLTMTNLAIKRYFGGSPPEDLRMVIDGLEIGKVPDEEVKRLRNVHLIRRKPLKGVSTNVGGVMLTATANGGIQVRIDDETYFIESAFSYAGEEGIGFNEWRCLPQLQGEAGWRPKVRRTDARTLEVASEGKTYRLFRQVTVKERLGGKRIEIADTIANKTDEVIGVLIRHELLTPGFPRAHRLSGLDEFVAGERRSPENPTAFVAQDKTAIGAVMEDSVLRLQMGSETTGNVVRLSFNHFGMPPKAKRVLRWALYPLRSKGSVADDFFAFINSVRRDWKVNFTILGPFDFVDSLHLQGEDAEARVKELVERKGVRIFALAPWLEYYSNPDMTCDEYKALVQKAIKVIKRVRPDAICIALLESGLAMIPISFFADTLPADFPYGILGHSYPIGKPPGITGWRAPKEATQRIDASNWRDSVIRDADGNVLLDTRYVHYYAGKALNLMVYPTKNNYWHKQMLDKIRFVLDEVGFDGVYFDLFGFASASTYERWDGCTVDIDEKTGRVVRKYSDLGLLTSPARIEWVKEVLRRGKIVVANATPAVMEEQSLPIFRFMETQGYDPLFGDAPNQWRCATGQLGSPIGLGYGWGYLERQSRSAIVFVRTVVAHLRYGLLYYYYGTTFPADGETGGEYGPVKHMFPMTSVELGEGFIIGKERIISCVSRTFEWRKTNRPIVRLFDERGRLLENLTDCATRTPSGWRITVRLRDWWQVAVVE